MKLPQKRLSWSKKVLRILEWNVALNLLDEALNPDLVFKRLLPLDDSAGIGVSEVQRIALGRQPLRDFVLGRGLLDEFEEEDL